MGDAWPILAIILALLGGISMIWITGKRSGNAEIEGEKAREKLKENERGAAADDAGRRGALDNRMRWGGKRPPKP